MANPTSTGIGQGAAQIFDTTGVTNLYGQILQRRQLQDERDSQAAAELMKQYDPNKQGLRKGDLADYNNLYNQYRAIYLNNKELYRNPMKHQADYNKANAIAAQMAELKGNSVELSKTFGEVGSEMFKNSSKFSNTVKDSYKSIIGMPVSQIKKMYGKIPSAVDFEEYRPAVQYDKLFDGMTKDLDGSSRFEETGRIEKWDSPAGKAFGIPEGQEGRFATRKYKPEDVSQLSLQVVADQQLHDNIFASIKDSMQTKEGQEKLKELQTWYDTNYNPKGDGMQMNVTTPEGFLTASYLQKNGVKEVRPTKFTENQDYKIKQEMASESRKNAAALELHKKKTAVTTAAQKELIKEREEGKPSQEDVLNEQMKPIVDALDGGLDNQDARVALNAAYDDNTDILFIAPSKGENFDDFKDRVRKSGTSRVSSGDLSDDDLQKMFDSKKGAYVVKKSSGNVVFKGVQNKKELDARIGAALNRTPKTTTKGGLPSLKKK